VFGFLLGLGTAVVLLHEYHRAEADAAQSGDSLVLLGPMLKLGALYLLAFPWLTWAAFAALRVRPAGFAALCALVLTLPALYLVQHIGPGSQPRPAWAYALGAAAGFSARAALVVGGASRSRPGSPPNNDKVA